MATITIFDEDAVRQKELYFRSLSQTRLKSKNLLSVGYDHTYNCVLTNWKDGAFIVYWGPPANGTACSIYATTLRTQSGKAIYNSKWHMLNFERLTTALSIHPLINIIGFYF